MKVERTIAVDIGNSAIKLAWLEADVLQMRTFPLHNRDWPKSLVREINVLRQPVEANLSQQPHSESQLSDTKPISWFAASVNDPASLRLSELVATEFPQDNWVDLTRQDVELPTDLRTPETVGIDRLLGAKGALRIARQMAKTESVISVDAGSAVTVDLVREGRFVGGAILPGIRLQLSVLSQATARLPAVAGEDSRPLEIPGKDTVSAIRCGVLQGIAGGIDRLIELYSNHSTAPIPVVLTGGDAAMLQPLISHPSTHYEGMVLSAILEIASARSLSLLLNGNQEPQNVSFD